jgi:hypothetical protein
MATIVVGTNSYVTVAEAEAYAADGGDSFTGDVSVMLIKAMRYLNLQNWSGTKTDTAQALDFPRNGDTDVPENIKQAQIVIALTYDGGADLLAPVERAVKSEKVDVIEVEYMDNAASAASYPYINALIGSYLSSNALTGGNTFEVYKGLH